jgi:hypothetical protein
LPQLDHAHLVSLGTGKSGVHGIKLLGNLLYAAAVDKPLWAVTNQGFHRALDFQVG